MLDKEYVEQAEPENGQTPSQTGLFLGQKEFVIALKDCICQACEQGANTLILCDIDFSLWPLDDGEVLAALQRWANSTSNQRMLMMVASSYAFIDQQHGGWVRWRKMWDQRVQCWQVGEQRDPNLPCVFWSEHSMLKVLDKGRCMGRVSSDRLQLSQGKAQLNEYIRQSDPAFPASTLGIW